MEKKEFETSEDHINETPVPIKFETNNKQFNDYFDNVKRMQVEDKRWGRQFKNLWALKPNFPVNALPEYRSKEKRWSRDFQNLWGLKPNFPVAWIPRDNGYLNKEKKMKENANGFEPDMEASNIHPGIYNVKRGAPYYLVH